MRYLFDIDGVICETEGTDYEDAEPREDVIKRIQDLHDIGHEVMFFTGRGWDSGKDWTNVTKQQLEDWGVPYDGLFAKPACDVLVDDKAVNVRDWMA